MTEYDDDGLNPTSTTYQSLDCAVHSLRWVMQVLIVGQTDQNRIQASYLYYIILIMRKLENRVGTFYTGLRQIPYLVGKQRERKMAHTELVLRERRTIEDMLNARMSVDRIAAKIGRHRSTVFRDIKRNRFVDDELPKLNGYYGMNAQRTAVTRRARRRNLVRFVDLRKHVITQLESGWSPEQIAGRLQYNMTVNLCASATRQSMPTFTAQMASPKNWHAICRIDERNASHDAVAHRVALFFHLIGQSMNGQTMLKRARHSVNGKAT